MFLLSASKVFLNPVQKEAVTSGAVNVFLVQFEFNDDWNELDRTAVFQAGDDKVSVVLDDTNQCQIPWEVLENPRRTLEVGVYGTKDGKIVLPTIWASLGTIKEGVSLGGNSQPPTPDTYSQILNIANEAKKIAQSVRDDADKGKFDGEQGPAGPPGQGVPEYSESDNGKILEIVNGEPKWVLSGGSGGTGNVSSQEVNVIKVLDRAEYDELPQKDPRTLYLIRG